MNQSDKLDLQTPNIVNENIEKIAEIFPNCVTESAEGKAIDFDLLKQELSNEIVEGHKERYRLEWPGKKEAIVTANLPINKTLRPVREDSVNFDTTQNLYIEGDNLEVLKLLQESYRNKIKMIYIDPPYNTGKDFVYKDNFTQDKKEFEQESDLRDEYNQRLKVNAETEGRYHSNWLTMMYPRLKLARKLLKNDGVIFISIDDNEVANLKKVCDEIFGEENFISQLTLVNNIAGRSDSKHIAIAHEYLLMYSSSVSFQSFGVQLSEKQISEFKYEDKIGKYRVQGLRKRGSNSRRIDRPNMFYPVYYSASTNKISLNSFEDSIAIFPKLSDGTDGCWRWGKDTLDLKINKIEIKLVSTRNEFDVFEKVYLEENGVKKKRKLKSFLLESKYTSDSATQSFKRFIQKGVFNSPKSIDLIIDLAINSLKTDDIVLDFFSGSSSSAHAILDLNKEDAGNRKFIMVQIPEATPEKSEAQKAGYKTIAEIGKERIRRAGKKIKEELQQEIEKLKTKNSLLQEDNDLITSKEQHLQNLDIGFKVFKVDSSNMKDVYYKPQDVEQDKLELFTDNVKEDRTPEDLLTQILLDWGLPLTLPTEILSIENKTVYKIAENSLMACFDNGIDESFAKAIAKHEPMRVVFKDSSFNNNDTAKENVLQLLKQLSPQTEMKVI